MMGLSIFFCKVGGVVNIRCLVERWKVRESVTIDKLRPTALLSKK